MLTRYEKMKYCAGCYKENYHYGLGGSKECWSFQEMKLVRRKAVHINQMPPWKQKAKPTASCYERPQWVYVGPDQEC